MARVKSKKTIPYKFSDKHKEYIRRCRECVYNIAEGAVRAGKTVDNIMAFCKELCDTPDKVHLATASTVAAAKLIIGDSNGFGLEHYFRGQCRWGKYKDNEALIICGKFTRYKKKIVIFAGGGKADSYKKLRGASYGMWIATEIDLHHEETIKEVIKRQAAAKRRKIFWDLNPGPPKAMIYVNYIDDFARKAAKGTLMGGYNYGHFTIHDNINIPEEKRNEFISLYDVNSAEYKRMILGNRCPSEGLIFQSFADVPKRFIISAKPKNIKFISIGVDFGGNKSKTTFVATAFIGAFEKIVTVADYKMKGDKGTIDPTKVCNELTEFYKYLRAEYPRTMIPYIFCDCEAQMVINGIANHFKRLGIKVAIRDCYKGKITDRIYSLQGLMTQGRYFVYEECRNVIDSLCTQIWDDEEETKDVRLDDGTADIDTADALEYSFSSFIKQLNVKGGDND